MAFWRFGFVGIIYVSLPLVLIVKKNYCFWQFHENWICLLEYFFHYFYEIFIYNYYLLIMPAVWAFCILLGLGALIIPEERHIPPAVCVGTALGSARSSPCTQIFICGSQSDWQTTQYTQESLQLRTQSWPQALFQFPVQGYEFPWGTCNLNLGK